MPAYQDLQVAASERWVQHVKVAKLQRQAILLSTDMAAAERSAAEAAGRLVSSVPDYVANEVHKTTAGGRIPELAPDLRKLCDDAGTVLERHIVPGPDGADRRRTILDIATAHATADRGIPDDGVKIAAEINLAQQAPRATRSRSHDFTPQCARELVEGMRKIGDALNRRLEASDTLFKNARTDRLGITSLSDITAEAARINQTLGYAAQNPERGPSARATPEASPSVDRYQMFLRNWTGDHQPTYEEVDRLMAGRSSPHSYAGSPMPSPGPVGNSSQPRSPRTPSVNLSSPDANRDAHPPFQAEGHASPSPASQDHEHRAILQNWSHDRQPTWEELHELTARGAPHSREESVEPASPRPSSSLRSSSAPASSSHEHGAIPQDWQRDRQPTWEELHALATQRALHSAEGATASGNPRPSPSPRLSPAGDRDEGSSPRPISLDEEHSSSPRSSVPRRDSLDDIDERPSKRARLDDRPRSPSVGRG